jgi:cation diffusion facilitator family transporter
MSGAGGVGDRPRGGERESELGSHGPAPPLRPSDAAADAAFDPRRALGSAGSAVLGSHAHRRAKTRAAGLSIASNAGLIALKLVAGVLTGSIAIITEAVHSSIDLIASIVAYLSVRKAGEPADREHPYGHAKVENLAAAFEGMLILVGAAVIVFESIRRLIEPRPVELLGFGIGVIAFSIAANVLVSRHLRRKARQTDSPALEGDAAHLRTDALTSTGVLGGLVLVEVTGIERVDPIVALLVAAVIVASGLRLVTRSSRVLVDEALPADELVAVRSAVEGHGSAEVVGFHALRARRAGSDRYVDLHVQFRRGTSLERAHELAHELTREIRARLRGADVLIHLEPEDAVRREEEVRSGGTFGVGTTEAAGREAEGAAGQPDAGEGPRRGLNRG